MKTFQKLLTPLMLCLFFMGMNLVIFAQNNATATATADTPPMVGSKDEAKTKIGKKVSVTGRFEAFKVEKLPVGNRAKVVLSDNSALILETGKKGLQKKCAMKKYLGKEVELTGTLVENARLFEPNASPIAIVALSLKDINGLKVKTAAPKK